MHLQYGRDTITYREHRLAGAKENGLSLLQQNNERGRAGEFRLGHECARDSCIISGFQTKLEADVLHLLLKRHVPVIIVLARRMYKTFPAEIQTAIDREEALVVSLSNSPRNCKENAARRNKYIIETADSIVVGAMDDSSSLPPCSVAPTNLAAPKHKKSQSFRLLMPKNFAIPSISLITFSPREQGTCRPSA